MADDNQSSKMLALIFVEKIAEALKEAAQFEKANLTKDKQKPEVPTT